MPVSLECPDALELLDFADGLLDEARRVELETHIDRCPGCFESMTAGVSDRPAMTLEPGETFGRYTVLEPLGEGAMGVVHAAYDSTLDRRVALKLLKPGGRDQSRVLLREARAMAKLSHPNVVAVHDAGTLAGGDRLFLAMALVRGATLSQWLGQRQRTWREVVEVFVAAGRGLEAAHQAGLVHRDFKPANVLIAEDGRTFITDLGLASTAVQVASIAAGADVLQTLRDGDGFVGTPAYAAPEQWQGRQADARSDQYSFAVALHEALYGERPFRADELEVLREAVVNGNADAPPTGRDVPAELHRIVVRCLATDPRERFGSMTEMLAALSVDPAARRRRKRALAVGGVAAVGLLAISPIQTRLRETACLEGSQTLARWWDGQRQSVSETMTAAGSELAYDTETRTIKGLDDYVDRWSAAKLAPCRAERVERTISSQQALRSGLCLDERKAEFVALAERLTQGNAETHSRAIESIGQLSRLDPCSDHAWLSQSLKLPDGETERREVQQIRERLAAVRTRRTMLDLSGALSEAEAVLATAEALDWPALVAHAKLEVGRTQTELADYEAARKMLEEAYYGAGRTGADEVAADAALGLAHLLGSELDQRDMAITWVHHAEMFVARLGQPDSLRASLFHRTAGGLSRKHGKYPAAQVHLDQAAAILERRFGRNHLRLAATLVDLGNLALNRQNLSEALEYYERALAIREEALGPGSPRLAGALTGIASVHRDRGEFEQALASQRRVLENGERALGLGHPSVTRAHINLATTHAMQGRTDRAIPEFERALASVRAAKDPTSAAAATVLFNLGVAYDGEGDHRRAVEYKREALSICEELYPQNHPMTAMVATGIGVSLVILGQLDEALIAHRRALAIQRALLDPSHPHLAVSSSNIGVVLRRQGNAEAARRLHEDALALAEQAYGPEHLDVAHYLLELGADHSALGSFERATELFERSLAIHKAILGDDHVEVAASLRGLGMTLFVQGNHRRSLAAFEEALAIWGDSPSMPGAEGWRYVGDIHLAARAYSEAIASYEKGLALLGEDGQEAARTHLVEQRRKARRRLRK